RSLPITTQSRHHLTHQPFPTRRSSDLFENPGRRVTGMQVIQVAPVAGQQVEAAVILNASCHLRQVLLGRALAAQEARHELAPGADRKSTRLNSSHVKISYAVFCLKKKK